ncbi:M15 family metallopeptidase [Nocardia sp. NPDC057668]|uniref:M15 family metallopeptidase n=1 Tax=Nocardia sp. NPDC057668 TaxID=3346202 RepID=UPI00366E53BC
MAGLRRWLLVFTVLGLSVGCGSGEPERGVPPTSAPGVRETTAVPPVSVVPPVSEQARAAGFVDVRTVVPDAVLDLRYATPDNFVGLALYPPSARCLVHESMAPGLVTAAERLRAQDAVLVFWDCYRPHEIQVRMFEAVPDPAWVARPGAFARSHEAGRSVDVTFARNTAPCPSERRLGDRCRADMGTDFDEFSPAAQAFATTGVEPAAQAERARLREAMLAGGLAVYPGEWWHFDGPGAYVERPILDVPVG